MVLSAYMLTVLTPANFPDYQLLDSGDGRKLEKFGQYILDRPDPQIIWQKKLPEEMWQKADAIFIRDTGEKGHWVKQKELPYKWLMKYNNLSFYCKLSPFKHTGVFPEQAIHWNEVTRIVLSAVEGSVRQPNILNLFGYTGIASLTAADAGAGVTHVDASYPTIGWARENQKASGLEERPASSDSPASRDGPIRWILDDAIKFCEREVRRGVKYDGIIMDPPVFGHGPNGEVWDFNKSLPKLIFICRSLLSKKPLFVIINAYAVSTSAITLKNILHELIGNLGGTVQSGELALKENSSERLLSTGIFARWSR